MTVNRRLPSKVTPELNVSEQEFILIEDARKKTKQSRNQFVTKAAIDRAKKVLIEDVQYNTGVEEVLSHE